MVLDDVIPLIITHMDYRTLLDFTRTSKNFYFPSPNIWEAILIVIHRLALTELTNYNPAVTSKMVYIPLSGLEFSCELIHDAHTDGLLFHYPHTLVETRNYTEYQVGYITGVAYCSPEKDYFLWQPNNCHYLSLFNLPPLSPSLIYRKYITIDQFKIIAHLLYIEFNRNQ